MRFGPRGFYYNTLISHNDVSAFAIDFTDYDGFNAANNHWRVLSATGGRVFRTGFNIPDDSSIGPNFVEIDTVPSGTNLFRSRYLHLAREVTPPVLAGMLVSTGFFIGRVQNTGNSAFSHLHFSIHNQRRPFPGGGSLGHSVRPTPMDGFRLEDGDESTCVASSNGGMPSVSVSVPTGVKRGQDIIARASINGGAAPFKLVWSSNMETPSELATAFGHQGGVPSTTNTTNLLAQLRFQNVGRHILTATVTDAVGRSSSSLVLVPVVHAASWVNIISPANEQVFGANEDIILSGVSFDPRRAARFGLDRDRPFVDSGVHWYIDWEEGSREREIHSIGFGHFRRISPGTIAPGTHRVRFRAIVGPDSSYVDRTFTIGEVVENRRPIVQIQWPETNLILRATELDPDTGKMVAPLDLWGTSENSEGDSLRHSGVIWTIEHNNSGIEEVISNLEMVHHNFELRDYFLNSLYKIRFKATDEHGASAETFRLIEIIF